MTFLSSLWVTMRSTIFAWPTQPTQVRSIPKKWSRCYGSWCQWRRFSYQATLWGEARMDPIPSTAWEFTKILGCTQKTWRPLSSLRKTVSGQFLTVIRLMLIHVCSFCHGTILAPATGWWNISRKWDYNSVRGSTCRRTTWHVLYSCSHLWAVKESKPGKWKGPLTPKKHFPNNESIIMPPRWKNQTTPVAGLRWLHMLECYSSPACFFLHCFELRDGSYLSGFISFKFDQYWDAINQNVLLWVVKLHPIPGYEDWMRRLQTSGGYSIINFWCHGFAEGERFFSPKNISQRCEKLWGIWKS